MHLLGWKLSRRTFKAFGTVCTRRAQGMGYFVSRLAQALMARTDHCIPTVEWKVIFITHMIAHG